MSSPKFPPGTTLHRPVDNHSRKPWAAQGSARGVEEPENPHAGKGEVSLAWVGTVSFTTNTTVHPFQACVSPCFPTRLCLFMLRAWKVASLLQWAPSGEERATSGQDSSASCLSPPKDLEPGALVTKGQQHQSDPRLDVHKTLSEGELLHAAPRMVLGKI